MPADTSAGKTPDHPPGCLLVVLRAQPRLILAAECPELSFWLDGKEYTRRSTGDWTGFYDWLRDDDGNLTGVRQWPFAEAEPWRDLLARLPASPHLVSPPGLASLAIYFGGNRATNRQSSNDQDFGQNMVFASADGEWAVSFGTAALSPSERQRLSTTLGDSSPVRTGPGR